MNNTTLLRRLPTRHQGQGGFTLVELVITMVIASILAAIAIPSYSTYIQKSRRAEAKSTLLNMASLEERFFSTNNSYSTNPVALGYPAGTVTPFPFGNSYYQIQSILVVPAVAPVSSASAGTPATYTITAQAIGPQVADTSCQTFTISSGGVQTSTPAGGSCW